MTNSNSLGLYQSSNHFMSPKNNFSHWIIIIILSFLVIGYLLIQ